MSRTSGTRRGAGAIAGTLPYMAPEVLRGEPADAREDDPAFSPDSERIAFQALGPDGIEEIHNVPFEGGPSKLLAGLRFNTRNNHFDISRDATRLVTTNAVHASDEIWLLEPPHR